MLEGYKVAKEIAAHGAGASTFSDWWGYKIEAEDAIPHNAAIMVRKGVLVSINSDDPEQMRRLNIEAAKTVRYGRLTDDEALATVTINPAKQLKIDQRVGSIEVGKDADLVIWNRHPLSSTAIVQRTYIDGVAYYDRVKDLARVAAIEKEKEQIRAGQRGRHAARGREVGRRRPLRRPRRPPKGPQRRGAGRTAGGAPRAHARTARRDAERLRSRVGHHQRAHCAGRRTDHRAGDDRDPRQPH